MTRKLYSYIKNDPFLKNNVTFFLGSLLIAFLNYLYYPIMSRVMSVEEFGEIQTIFSLVFLSGVVLTVFKMIVLHITANSEEEKNTALLPDTTAIYIPASESTDSHQSQNAQSSIPSLFTAALIIHLPFLIVLLFCSPLISRFFSFQSSYDFSIFSFYLFLSIYLTFYTAYIHGKNAFNTLTISQIIGAGGKLILSFILVSIGLGTTGAVGALVLISFFTIIYVKNKSHGLILSFASMNRVIHVLKKELLYGLLVFLSLGFVTILYSADVLIIKRLFSPEIAGLYSGIATVARIIFFITASISGVLISSIIVNDTRKNNRKILKKATLLIIAIGGSTLLFFSFFPVFTITLLVGTKYIPYAHLLPGITLYLFLVSILNLFVSYLLAIRSYALFSISGIGILLLSIMLFMHHESPTKVILAFTISALTTLILSILAIFSRTT